MAMDEVIDIFDQRHPFCYYECGWYDPRWWQEVWPARLMAPVRDLRFARIVEFNFRHPMKKDLSQFGAVRLADGNWYEEPGTRHGLMHEELRGMGEQERWRLVGRMIIPSHQKPILPLP